MLKLKLWFNNKNNTYSVIFILLFVIICFIYQYHKIIFLRPQSMHQWRQTICLSYSLNYYQHGMNFFMPEVHMLVADGGTTGYSATEFPLLYFLNALLWKIFGVHEFIPRLLNILLVFLGFFSLFKIICKRTNAYWATVIPLLFFTSPGIAFYTVTSLSDSPAFGIALISLYAFDKFTEKQQYKWLYLFMLFSLIAGLLKVTSVMIFAAIFMIFILEKIGILFFKAENKIFKGGWKDLLLFIGTVAGIAAWYFWAMLYNEKHGGYISDSKILPIWDMNAEEIFNVIKSVDEIMWYQFLSPHTTFLFLFLSTSIIFLKQKTNKYLWFLTMFLFAGTITYILLWFLVWGNHDYYMFPIFYFFIVMLIAFLDHLKNILPVFYESKVLKIIFFLFLVYNIWYCSNNIRMKYGIDIGKISLTSTTTETGLWKWCDWHYGNTIKAYETIEPYIRSIGITLEDKVISIPDESICTTLYLMNRKGWTNYGNPFLHKDCFAEKIKVGAKYLLLNDTTLMDNEFIKPYTKNKIGQFKNVSIFDLRQFKK